MEEDGVGIGNGVKGWGRVVESVEWEVNWS